MAITIADHHPSYPSWAITKDIDTATKMSPGPEAKLLREAALGRECKSPSQLETALLAWESRMFWSTASFHHCPRTKEKADL